MVHFDRVDVSEGNDDKCINSIDMYIKKCIICHYSYSLDKGLKFQPFVCNGCHYVLMMSIKPSDLVILNICGLNYCCIANGTSKNKATNLLQNANLTEISTSL